MKTARLTDVYQIDVGRYSSNISGVFHSLPPLILLECVLVKKRLVGCREPLLMLFFGWLVIVLEVVVDFLCKGEKE